MNRFIGIDGCRFGWVYSIIQNNALCLEVHGTLSDLKSSDTIVIDMPVLLPKTIQDYPRLCDISAKQRLKKYHGSIFYAPLASWLTMEYQHINEYCTHHKKPKLSKQSYNLFKAIQMVQTARSKMPITFFESHPELFFRSIKSDISSKKSAIGQRERKNILIDLAKQNAITIPWASTQSFFNDHSKQLGMDDILDACGMAFVAYLYKQDHDTTNSSQLIFY